MNLTNFPKMPGTYAVVMRLDHAQTLQIGRLGTFTLEKGLYAYIGSAHGPGGLQARLARHLRTEKTLHWHIDYVTTSASITAIWWSTAVERLECTWAQRLNGLSGVRMPVPGFGSSDCACESHLFALTPKSIRAAYDTLKQSAPGLQITDT